MSVDINALRGLLEKATPGPWEFGGWSGRCHKIHNGRPGGGHPGPPECVYDEEWHEPYCGKHEIASRSKAGALVAGNYNCEEGGIINDADADLIIALRNNAGALLDEVDALKARLAAAEARARAAEAQRDDAKQSGDQSWRGFQQVCFAMTGTSDVVSFMDALKPHSTAEAYAQDLRVRCAAAEAAAATAKVAAGLMRDRAEKAEARAERAVGMLLECGNAFARQEEPDGLCERIAALLKEVSHGQQG